MSWLGLLAAAQADRDPDIQAAIAGHHREDEAAWAAPAGRVTSISRKQGS
jgi:hypothetical protein